MVWTKVALDAAILQLQQLITFLNGQVLSVVGK